MAALVPHLEAVRCDILLAHLQIVRRRLAVLQVAPAAFVERKLGVDQIAVVLHQPGRAVVGPAAFFVGGQRDDEIAIGPEAFTLVADQVRDPDGGLRLVVDGPAAIEEAVLFGQLERIHGPVGRLGLHYVEMSQQQQRLALAGAVIAYHHVHLMRRRAQHLDVGRSESLRTKQRGHRLGRGRRGAGTERGIDLDELLINVVREFLVFRRWQSRGAQCRRETGRKGDAR